MKPPVTIANRLIWRDNGIAQGTSEGTRAIPEETAVALTYNGGTYAVMMATPQDLEDFAIGFSLHEGVVESLSEIQSLEVLSVDDGVECRMWVDQAHAERLSTRRRQIAGPTGCGLCGVDSIAEAVKPAAIVSAGHRFLPRQIMDAMAALPSLQKLNIETRAVHAAAYWTPEQGIVELREDVGRHNALDKLGGAMARRAIGRDGMILLTSRVSVEMVQKTATIGVSTLVSVSAPTSLAVRMADEAGITLVAIARADGFEVFTHADRILPGASSHVA